MLQYGAVNNINMARRKRDYSVLILNISFITSLLRGCRTAIIKDLSKPRSTRVVTAGSQIRYRWLTLDYFHTPLYLTPIKVNWKVSGLAIVTYGNTSVLLKDII